MKRKAGNGGDDAELEAKATEEVAMVYGVEGKPPKVFTQRN